MEGRSGLIPEKMSSTLKGGQKSKKVEDKEFCGFRGLHGTDEKKTTLGSEELHQKAAWKKKDLRHILSVSLGEVNGAGRRMLKNQESKAEL